MKYQPLLALLLVVGACRDDRCTMTADQKTDLVCVFEEQHRWAVDVGVIAAEDRWYEDVFYSKLEDCRDSAMNYLSDFIRMVHDADPRPDPDEREES